MTDPRVPAANEQIVDGGGRHATRHNPLATPAESGRRRPRIRVLWELIVLATSSAAAVALVSDGYREPGAMFRSAAALAIGLLVIPAIRAFRNPISAFQPDHLLMLGLVYWLLLDLIQGTYPLDQVSRVGIENALAGVAVFAGGVWLGAALWPWRLPRVAQLAAATPLGSGTLFGAICICFALGFFRFAFPSGFDIGLMVESLGQNRWNAPWSRGELGGWDAIIDHLSYFGYVVPALTVMLAQRARRMASLPVIIAIVFSLIMLVFLGHGGARRVVGVVCGAALVTWVLSQWGRVRLRTIAIAALAALALIGLLQWVLEYRNVGYATGFSSEEELQYEHVHVDDNILRAAQVMEIIPARHDYVKSQLLVWIAARPVPRVLWPGKPSDPGFDLSTYLGYRRVSLSSSVIGEAYMGFGWIGILGFGLVYGRLAGMYQSLLDRHRTPASILLYSFGVLSLFAGIRSALDLVLMSYTLLVLVFLLRLLARREPAVSRA